MTDAATPRNRRWWRLAVHTFRIALLVAIVGLIHLAHRRRVEAARAREFVFDVPVDRVREVLPTADALGEVDPDLRTRDVLDESGQRIGYVLQTSPDGDEAIGFSGPTNLLLGFDSDDRLAGVVVLSSEDTEEHVEQIVAASSFLDGFDGLTWDEAAAGVNVDAVSGATLTSLAIREAITRRLAEDKPLARSLKFPEPPQAEDVRDLYTEAATLEPRTDDVAAYRVLDDAGTEIGSLLRTAFSAEDVIGYQGPTETYIGLDNEDRVVGFVPGDSYDNEPYVGYVRDEMYYLDGLKERSLADLAELDLAAEGIEGVSGATMTSMAVARGLAKAARAHLDAHRTAAEAAIPEEATRWQPSNRDLGTCLVVLVGVVAAFTSLRGSRWFRVPFQLVLVGYLGFVNGDLVSQASLVGWGKHGVPWRTTFGLAVLSAAALLVPIVSKRNVYCSHLCPHGAAQQLLRNRIPWQWRLPKRLAVCLSLVPGLLLVWVVAVATTGWAFSLVDIEPFDAYVFRVAGWATLVIAVVGLVASAFIPMAYCRFGCPTGALLGFLRFSARSDRLTIRDGAAVVCLGVAACCLLGGIGT